MRRSFAFMFWAFLIYPNLAIMTLKGLRCTEVAGQDLLAVDLRAPCPSNSPGSVEFLWPLIVSCPFTSPAFASATCGADIGCATTRPP